MIEQKVREIKVIINYDKEIEIKIVNLFVNSSEPFNISDVARLIKTQRITAKKHLKRLSQKGLIEELKKPSMRLYWRKVSTELLTQYLESSNKDNGGDAPHD